MMTEDDIPNFFGKSQGAKAVRSGRTGEEILESYFRPYKIRFVKDDRGYHGENQLFPHKKPFMIRQFRWHTGKKYCVDFMWMGFPSDLKLPIEVKTQYGPGTTDEKLMRTIDRIVKSDYPYFWLVLVGDGFRREEITEVYRSIRDSKRGCIIPGHEDFLYRAVEKLVVHGDPKG
jgi:hypothetical protein